MHRRPPRMLPEHGTLTLTKRFSAPAGGGVVPNRFAIENGQFGGAAAAATTQGGLATAGRASAAAVRARDHAEYRVPEVGVDGRIENEVDGEVDRLQQVSDGDGDVEHLRRVLRLGGQVDEEIQQFGGNEQHDEHDYDDDEGEVDAIGGLFAALTRDPPHLSTECRRLYAVRQKCQPNNNN